MRLSFIVNRPADEPGFRLQRQEVQGRGIRYTPAAVCDRAARGAALLSRRAT